MASKIFSVRIDKNVKKRPEDLAKSTEHTSSYLAAEAIDAYLDVHEWQVNGIKQAIVLLDAGEAIQHAAIRDWVASWDENEERPAPNLHPHYPHRLVAAGR